MFNTNINSAWIGFDSQALAGPLMHVCSYRDPRSLARHSQELKGIHQNKDKYSVVYSTES
jgi:hypothetical protein